MLSLYFFIDQIPSVVPDLQAPDFGAYFWQILATVFGTLTIWMVKRDLAKRDAREEKNAESITTLKTNVAVLSKEVEGIRADIDHLIESR